MILAPVEKMVNTTDLTLLASQEITKSLNSVLADVFAMYMKTKNFHWHMSGVHFRSLHLLFDEQAQQLFLMTDAIAERVRKVGGRTLRSIGEIHRTKHIIDNDADYVSPKDMLTELRDDNTRLTVKLRQARNLCDQYQDFGSTSMLEVWIDQSETRSWFLYESNLQMAMDA